MRLSDTQEMLFLISMKTVEEMMEENKERAKELYNLGKKELTQVHKVRTHLSTSEANGEKVNTNVDLIMRRII